MVFSANGSWVSRKCVNDENFCAIRRDNVNCEKCMCINLKVMFNLLVTALIIALLLIVSGNVELNPGPMKKCPKCEKMMPTRSNNCKCGHLLCYVARRGLHFSTFISLSIIIVVQSFYMCVLYKLSFCNNNLEP